MDNYQISKFVNRDKKINLVYITDDNYAMATCVSIVSAIKNKFKKTKMSIYVIACNLCRENSEALKQIFTDKDININILEVDGGKYSAFYDESKHVTPTALYKFDLSNVFDHLDKVLYLDGDVIIQSDLSDLYNTNIDEYYLAAVNDMGDTSDLEGRSKTAKKINLNHYRYFNSGVMLLNLEAMRKDKISDKLLKYRKYGKNNYMDQDAFNYVCGTKSLVLDYRYNFLTRIIDKIDFCEINKRFFKKVFLNLRDCINGQVILHCTFKYKPWEYNIPVLSDIFKQYYKLSPFSKRDLKLKVLKEGEYEYFKSALEEENGEKKDGEPQRIFPFYLFPINSRILLYGDKNISSVVKNDLEENNNFSIIASVEEGYDDLLYDYMYDYVLIVKDDKDEASLIKKHLVDVGIREEIIKWDTTIVKGGNAFERYNNINDYNNMLEKVMLLYWNCGKDYNVGDGQMSKSLICGVSKSALRLKNRVVSYGGAVVGFLKTAGKCKSELLEGVPVYGIDDLPKIKFDVVYIADNKIEVLDQILNKGISKDKIILDFEDIYGDEHLLLAYLRRNKFCLDIRCNAPLVITRAMSFNKNIPHTEATMLFENRMLFNDDYVRYGTLDLIVREIEHYNVPGDIAELGVYRGKFASLLNEYFPKRQLHLFDTFEGFDARDTIYENEFSKAESGRYSDTSVDYIMNHMKNPENVLIYKGFFPETTPEKELKFAFVSLDCDLYKPVLAGLNYFYPRLENGGYIMLHDYNGGYGEGVHAAISDYEKMSGLHLVMVPIPDEAGTIVISK